VLRKCFNAKHV